MVDEPPRRPNAPNANLPPRDELDDLGYLRVPCMEGREIRAWRIRCATGNVVILDEGTHDEDETRSNPRVPKIRNRWERLCPEIAACIGEPVDAWGERHRGETDEQKHRTGPDVTIAPDRYWHVRVGPDPGRTERILIGETLEGFIIGMAQRMLGETPVMPPGRRADRLREAWHPDSTESERSEHFATHTRYR